MFGRSGTVQLATTRALAQGRAGVTVVIGFAMLMILSSVTAQACPPGKGNNLVSIAYKAKHALAAIAVASVVTMQSFANDTPLCVGQCCGGGCHTHGGEYANGCCFAGSTAIDVTSPSIDLLDGSIRHHLSSQDRGVPTEPPPNFRPPRTFV